MKNFMTDYQFVTLTCKKHVKLQPKTRNERNIDVAMNIIGGALTIAVWFALAISIFYI